MFGGDGQPFGGLGGRLLDGRLTQQFVAALELLIVEVVAIGKHYERGILHRRVLYDARRKEEHGEALG